MSYLSRLNEKDETKNQKSNELAALQASEAIKGAISQTKVTKANLDAALDASLGSKPFNIEKYVNIAAEAKANSERAELLQALLTTEFTD